MVSQLVGWMVGQLVSKSVSWFDPVGWLAVWMDGYVMVSWSVRGFAGWLVSWLDGWLVSWLV